jgi:membrane dipeptidase
MATDLVVVDGHVDLPTRLFHDPVDLSVRHDSGHVDLPRLRAGGVGALVAALYVPSFLSPERGMEHLLALHEALETALVPGGLELAVTAAEVRRNAAAGVVSAIVGVENGRPLILPGALDRVAALGARYVTLTHVASHEWCDAAGDEPLHGGLSDDGVRLVREMRRRGILTDVSHVSDDAVSHALDALRSPLVASHSSARALCDHPRNLPDDLVRDVARWGGVVMANSYPAFLDREAARANAERLALIGPLLAEIDADPDPDPRAVRDRVGELIGEVRLPPVPLATLVDHLVHLVEVAGEEHVGVGSDFDGITDTCEGFEDVSRYPALAEALGERGLPERVVGMILGGNFLRLLEDAERRAG